MQTSLRRWAMLAAFGLLAALPQVARATEPCNLLTAQEIAQVLGNPVSYMPIGATGCLWKGSPQGINITVRNASAWPRITAQGPGITKTDVPGIGDAASFSGTQNMWTLSVKKGDNVIVLTVTGAKTPDQQRSSEQSLAQLALKRL